jgi:peptidoglycan-associated lipoprotein
MVAESVPQPEVVAVVATATSAVPASAARTATAEPVPTATVSSVALAASNGPAPPGEPAAKTVEPESPPKAADQEPAPTPATSPSAPAFGDIQFGTRSAELSEVAQTRLHQVAQAMRRDKTLKLLVRGHTDERGDDSDNRALAAARADNSARFIARLGVARSRISLESVGSEDPVDPAGTREAWAKNRRVQFVWK